MHHQSGLSALILGVGLLSSISSFAADVEVKMLNQASNGQRGFEPAIVHISPGDSVHFVAVDKGHSVQAIPGMIPEGAKPFSGKPSDDLVVKFDRPGVYGYRCVPHYMMGMVGLVVVGDAVNEAAARRVAQPRDAKASFDRLFAELDAKRNAWK
ncbi:pseudoazurin [Trinickia caryophylli]|uniref:Pseudoazurin n=1 Tax=Trinickia caryophylli TaxID=28094 RepID=A0A1X7CTL5_TRICW|nr:pseudoazurin [Trinickia caryophylli]PMS13373.1 pseudoazurin [Trinickia caryophylli]TRX13766.1 pseudoazurin [Trinickia caryophylli]WQE15359.1 pseudoazurin [Trinickia caryophylli]SMF02940.1 pseudoazurin [Trinickia caryophylli]GLU30878.1 pseudoazurin [Trinickia caryophylli]